MGSCRSCLALRHNRLRSKSRWANTGEVGEKLFSCELLNVASWGQTGVFVSKTLRILRVLSDVYLYL